MKNHYSLVNKRILITGASSGIGRESAQVFAQAGATVIITGRNVSRLEEVYNCLSGSGHTMVVTDFLSENVIVDICNSITEPIDGILHSAGISQALPYKFSSYKVMEKMMKTNFEVPYLLTQQLFKKRLINSGGSVLFLSSIGGCKMGSAGISIYGASKNALNAAMRVIATEMAPKKIRVNSLLPGLVRTNMISGDGVVTQDDYNKEELRYPLGFGVPADVANTAMFFLSDASKWITGTEFVIDGGVTVR